MLLNVFMMTMLMMIMMKYIKIRPWKLELQRAKYDAIFGRSIYSRAHALQ